MKYIEGLVSSEIKEKKSKFIGFLYPINSLDDIKLLIIDFKKKYSDAKHIVYAYSINQNFGSNDDKEPAGTAGKEIKNALINWGVDDCILLVVRYFGGTLLGKGLLSRTYYKVADLTLEKALFYVKEKKNKVKMRFTHEYTFDINYILHDEKILETTFEDKVTYECIVSDTTLNNLKIKSYIEILSSEEILDNISL
ncbi:MAG: YigZ family protein [Acholeplasmatales bacterium]|jgi:putative IMPACT (imprinted ancient) family translation regulator|nr:YigZ family protein [Acholeplasmatales bacterium]